MAKQRPPEVTTYSLEEFFVKFYTVPAYQRNYAWTEVEVKQLLKDLVDFHNDVTKPPYYLLGDVIVVDSDLDDYDFELIDGQQRITTLVLIFAVLHRLISKKNPSHEDLAEIQTLVKKKRFRIRMSGEGNLTLQEYILGAVPFEQLPKKTPSQKAVAEAIYEIENYLGDSFGDEDSTSYAKFYRRIIERVFLSRVSLYDRDAAFDYFERVNDRGRPLSKTDLLKNRLLHKINSDEDFETASDNWAAAEKVLMPFGREGTMPFLLKAMFQAQEKKKVKDSSLYTEWRPFVESEEGCLKLIDEIAAKSEALAKILSGATPSGAVDPNVAGSKFMKFAQNFVVLLAGSHLQDESYLNLSRRIEHRALLSLFAQERSQVFEGNTVNWANAVSKLKEDASPTEIATAVDVSKEELETLLEMARIGVSTLRYGKTSGQTNRIRLLLAMVTMEIHAKALKQHYELADLLKTSKKTKKVQQAGYDIEHIGAASTERKVLGDEVDSLGNLTLFHFHDNRSAGNKSVEFKADDYRGSIIYITAILSSDPQLDSALERALQEFRGPTVNSGDWTKKEVDERFDFYWGIFESMMRRELQLPEHFADFHN